MPQEIKMFKHHFMLIDLDHGGTIDANELQDLTESLGSRLPEDQAQNLIDQFDQTKSGTLNFQDFLTLMYRIKSGTLVMTNNVLVTALMESKNQMKIMGEIEDIQQSPPENVMVYHYGNTPIECDLILLGPQDSIYENAQFKIRVIFLQGYPYQMPSVKFLSRILAVNVLTQTDGTGFLPHLSKLWDSQWNMRKLIDHIFTILLFPDMSLVPAPIRQVYDSWQEETYGPKIKYDTEEITNEPTIKLSYKEIIHSLPRVEQMHLNILSLYNCEHERFVTSAKQMVSLYASELFISSDAVEVARSLWKTQRQQRFEEEELKLMQQAEKEQRDRDRDRSADPQGYWADGSQYYSPAY